MAPRRAAFSLLPPSRRGRGVTPPIREWESGRWDRGRPAEGAGGGSPLLCRDRRLVPWRILVAHIHPFRHTAQSCCPRPSLSSPGCIPGRKCVQAPRRLSTDSGGRSAPPFQLQRERERERENACARAEKSKTARAAGLLPANKHLLELASSRSSGKNISSSQLSQLAF